MTKLELSINYPPAYCSAGNIKATMEREGHECTISEVLDMMTHVLRGAGYCFDGHVTIVNDEDDDATTTVGKISKSEARRRQYLK